MIGYGPRALPKLSLFKRYRNSVDIITEDLPENRELYSVIMSRLFQGSRLTIRDVNPIGSRTDVLKQMAIWKTSGSTQPCFFIIDGDYLVTLKEIPSNERNFRSLDRYCLENYLVDLRLFVDHAHSLLYTKSKVQVESDLDMANSLANYASHLVPLAIHYAIGQKYGVGRRFRSIHCYWDKQVFRPDEVTNEIQSIKSAVVAKIGSSGGNGLNEYQSCLEKLSSYWPATTDSLLRILSGKDVLIPLLHLHLGSKCGRPKDSFDKSVTKMIFAKNCELTNLQFLREAIEESC
jgi:hypothetical protein